MTNDNVQILPILNDGERNVVEYDAFDWAELLKEKVYEATGAARCYKKTATGERLTAVKTICESWLNALGYTEKERANLQRRENEENEKNGFLRELQRVAPCPFCGADVRLVVEKKRGRIKLKHKWETGCMPLPSITYTSADDVTEKIEELVGKWNTRAKLPSTD